MRAQRGQRPLDAETRKDASPDTAPAGEAAIPPGAPAAPTLIDGLLPEAWRDQRRNFRWGVANGVVFTLVDAFISPTVVLPWFVSGLGGANVLVGLLPAIANGGWFLPQIFVAGRIQHLPRKMPWYRTSGLIRVAAMAALVPLTYLLLGNPGLLLAGFFLLYSVYCLAGGVSGIPWLETVAKTVPPRRRGSFFGLRAFWGGVLALSVSGLVSYLLDQGQRPGSPWAFPTNFAVSFALSTLAAAGGIFCWLRVREPADYRASGPPRTLRDELHRGPQILRQDRSYRAFVTARCLVAFASVADPFYVVFAKDQLHAPGGMVGVYLAALTVSGIASNLIWSPLADRAGPRAMMWAVTLSVLTVPLTALVLPAVLTAAGLLGPAASAGEWGYYAFGLVFVLSGFATGAGRIINNNLLLDIAPAAERATYIGFLNTILGVATFIPVMAAAAFVSSFQLSTRRVEA